MRQKKLLVVTLVSLVGLVACANDIDADTVSWLQKNFPGMNNVPSSSSAPTTTTVTDSSVNVQSCTTDKNEQGVCVKYYLCDVETKSIIDDGFSIIDFRSGDVCPNFLDVCCLQSQVVEKKTITTTSPPTSTVTQSPVFTITSPPYTSDTRRPFGKCGYSNPGASVFVTKDNDPVDDRLYADYGEFPWMVAILKRGQDPNEWHKENYIGGGSLIHPSVVLTVAHKLTSRKPADLKIRAGEWETTTSDEEYGHQERDVAKIVVHDDYFRPSLYNDAGLLFLQEPVTLTNAPHIGIGCLARTMPRPDTDCFSMGWGAENFKNKKIFANVLKKVKLQLVSSDKCEGMLQKTRLGRIFRLHSSLTCAGGKAGIDTCKGDGGSPLVCPTDPGKTRFVIVGLVAYGIQCGSENVPGVYVNVPAVYDWVTSQMDLEGYGSSSYFY